jgi:ribose/xylose/arabinose/galactoside ABC-type transport system permease subunit
MTIMLKKMVWGRWIVAIGGNREGAARMGIPTRRVLGSVYVVAGLMAGASAILIAGLADAGYPDQGDNILFCIAAVVVGGASLSGGRGSVLRTVVGAVILATINNGLTLMSIGPNWASFAVGGVLVAAVAVERVRARVEARLRVHQALTSVGR